MSLRKSKDLEKIYDELGDLIVQGTDLDRRSLEIFGLDHVDSKTKTAAHSIDGKPVELQIGTFNDDFKKWQEDLLRVVAETKDGLLTYKLTKQNDVDIELAFMNDDPTGQAEERVYYSKMVPHLLKTTEEIMLVLDQRINVSTQKEIAMHERDISARYTMRYTKGVGLTINEFLLAKPNSFSENYGFANFLFEHDVANRVTKISEYEETLEADTSKKKSIKHILQGLNIEGDVRKAFFPEFNDERFYFRNPITYEMVREYNIPTLYLNECSKK